MMDAILGALWGSGVPVIVLALAVAWLLPAGQHGQEEPE